MQPSVARVLIEQQSNVEKGLCQRFLWIVPKPKIVTFEQLQKVDDTFTAAIGELCSITPHNTTNRLTSLFTTIIIVCTPASSTINLQQNL